MNVQRNLRKEKMAEAPPMTYQDLLNLDPRPSPAFYEHTPRDLGTEPVSARVYTDPERFQREVEKVWMKTWQFACRDEDIPNIGDTHVYDLLGKTVIVVRQDDGGVLAFQNVCRHRGRKLVNASACKSSFRCAYHGFTWSIDGKLIENPFAWDFPQIKGGDLPLFAVRSETWGGFIFINFDDAAEPLLSLLGPMPEHFAHWKIDNCYRSAYVAKIAHSNWKVCAEAFLEAHHVICTHPEYNLFSGYDLGQHDVLTDHVTRFLSPTGVSASLDADRGIDDARRIELMLAAGNRALDSKKKIEVPEGVTSRAFAANSVRTMLGAKTGYDFSDYSDADMVDGQGYDIFPNFHLWGGFKDKISYRFRPLTHDTTLMEVMLYGLAPKDGEKPAPAAMRTLGPDDKWATAAELGALGPVFDQDFSNMGPVQEGLEALGDESIQLSRYLEVRCRNLHRMIEVYLAR